MFYPVKILGPNGTRIIQPTELARNFWKREGYSTAAFMPKYKEPRQANCLFCGDSFVQNSLQQKYCKKPGLPVHQQCQQVSYRKRAKEAKGFVEIQKPCIECGNPFTVTHKRTKFCGKPCKFVKPPHVKVGRKPRLCLCCLEPFAPRSNGGKFCHDPCTHKHYKASIRRRAMMGGVADE